MWTFTESNLDQLDLERFEFFPCSNAYSKVHITSTSFQPCSVSMNKYEVSCHCADDQYFDFQPIANTLYVTIELDQPFG